MKIPIQPNQNMKKILLTTLVMAFGLALATTHAAGSDWKRLGQKEADQKLDHDEVIVGADEGAFKSIKLTVLKADVEFISVRVVFSNGADQQIEMRNKIRAGGETRAIDLDGRNRSIRKVVFNYRAKKKARKPAIVVLYGRR
jgi:hypothetical protein